MQNAWLQTAALIWMHGLLVFKVFFKLNLADYANEHALRHELIQAPPERIGTDTADWRNRIRNGLCRSWFRMEQLENALNHLEDCPDPRILVLGCGSGKRAVAVGQYFLARFWPLMILPLIWPMQPAKPVRLDVTILNSCLGNGKSYPCLRAALI